MRPSFSLRSFDTISMRGRSIRVLPCKMKIAFPGITGDVRRMKMPLPCCGHDNTVEGNWSLCLRSATPPPWFSTPLIRVLSAAKFHQDTNLALFLECRSVLVEIKKRERERFEFCWIVTIVTILNILNIEKVGWTSLGNVLRGRGPKALKKWIKST